MVVIKTHLLHTVILELHSVQLFFISNKLSQDLLDGISPCCEIDEIQLTCVDDRNDRDKSSAF